MIIKVRHKLIKGKRNLKERVRVERIHAAIASMFDKYGYTVKDVWLERLYEGCDYWHVENCTGTAEAAIINTIRSYPTVTIQGV